MIRPKPLKKGDTIGLIASSSYVEKEKVEEAIIAIKRMGFKVKAGESCYGHYGYFAAEDEIRVKDINKMFADRTVKGIFAIRGGYGSARLLDNINFDMIKKNPKIFIGYSDITALHIAINQRCNLVTFHGPMPATELCKGIDEYTKYYYEKSIFTNEPLGVVATVKDDMKVIVDGVAEGKLIGGNLTLIAASIGTKYEIDTRGKILFIEDVDEKPYRLDRMLLQLHQSGKFRDCKGIVLGAFTDCEATDKKNSLTLEEVINEIIVPNNKPIISNIKCGHCLPTLTLPLGARARIDGENGIFQILE